jgi:hypothetical protein
MIDGERKLATIRRISSIDPIPGADQIVKLTIDGWELVSQKDNFKPNDLCVYFEVDSFLPVREEFEFLRSRCFKSTSNIGNGFHLRTIKLRGQISQGLALPLAEFNFDDAAYHEGDDVTVDLGVKKWEAPPQHEGNLFGPSQSKGNFPTFLRKTDQERVQNCLRGVQNWIEYAGKSDPIEMTEAVDIEWLDGMSAETNGTLVVANERTYWRDEGKWFTAEKIKNEPEVKAERMRFEQTLKLDGSSLTVYYNEGQIGVCSRNLDLKRNMENLFWKTGFGTLMALCHLGRNIAVQGELMGPGVQGNREGLEDHRFYVFDVYDIDQARYFTPSERYAFIENLVKEIGADCLHVPVLGVISIMESTVADFLANADRPSINHKIAEGVVYKSCLPNGPTFKAINNKFLLAEKD